MLRLFAQRQLRFHRGPAVRLRAHGAVHPPGAPLLLVRGLNYSIEFTGGTLVQVESKTPVDVARLRDRPRPRGHPRGRDPELRRRQRVRGAGPRSQAGHRRERHPGDRRRGAAALDNVLGAGNYTIAPDRGGRPQGRRRAPPEGVPGHLPLVLRRAGLSGVPLRVALRAGRRHRDGARHPGHDRLHRRSATSRSASRWWRRCCRWWGTRSTTRSSSSTGCART